MTSFLPPQVYLQSSTQIIHELHIRHIICATSISFGTLPPFHLLTWVRIQTQVYQVASNFEESYLSSACSSTWTRSEWTQWTFESESSATKNPETAKKCQFCCEHRTIVEDWRGMVVVNWMIFFICFNDAHDLFWKERTYMCNPSGLEKSQTYHDLSSEFYTWHTWSLNLLEVGIGDAVRFQGDF